MSIPTFSNGDSNFSIRTQSLNPAIEKVNELDVDLNALEIATVRTKAEAVWNSPIVIPTTQTNLITLLNSVTPSSGSLTSPLINISGGKIQPLNKDKTMFIKLSLAGSYALGGASTDKALLLSLTGGVTDSLSDFKGGGLFSSNDAVITFITLISVDVGGNAATLGVTPFIQAMAREFTTTRVVLTINQ